MSADHSDAVHAAVTAFLTRRAQELGRDIPLTADTDVFAAGIVDSMELTELVGFVEQQLGHEVDFIEVDPDALDTVQGIVRELTAALILDG